MLNQYQKSKRQWQNAVVIYSLKGDILSFLIEPLSKVHLIIRIESLEILKKKI